MFTIFRAGVTAVTVAALLSGCSLFGGDAKDSADSKPSAGSSIDPDRTSPSDLPEVPQIKDFEGAVKDVKVGECPADKGKNTVSGSVKNATEAEQDYVITISWITSRSDVVARGVATVKNLGAGDSKKWSVTGTLAKKGAYTCTTQVQRGQL